MFVVQKNKRQKRCKIPLLRINQSKGYVWINQSINWHNSGQSINQSINGQFSIRSINRPVDFSSTKQSTIRRYYVNSPGYQELVGGLKRLLAQLTVHLILLRWPTLIAAHLQPRNHLGQFIVHGTLFLPLTEGRLSVGPDRRGEGPFVGSRQPDRLVHDVPRRLRGTNRGRGGRRVEGRGGGGGGKNCGRGGAESSRRWEDLTWQDASRRLEVARGGRRHRDQRRADGRGRVAPGGAGGEEPEGIAIGFRAVLTIDVRCRGRWLDLTLLCTKGMNYVKSIDKIAKIIN